MQNFDPNLRICLIVTSLSQGGLARQVLVTAPELAKFGSVSLVATVKPGVHWAEAMQQGFWRRLVSVSARNRLARYWQLYQFLRVENFTVVHVHQEPYAAIVARLAGIGTVVETVHAREWHFAGNRLVRILREYFTRRFVAVSSDLRDWLGRNGSDRLRRKLVFIENGVAVPSGHAGARPFPDPAKGRLRLGVVSRLETRKGVESVLQAYALVFPKIPASELVVVGSGSLHSELCSLAERLGLQDHVRFVGYTTDPETWIQSFDVFINPSEVEGYGLSVMEALARAVPTLSTPVPSIQGWGVHQHNLWLLKTGCVESLQQGILSVCLNRGLYQELSREGLAALQRSACSPQQSAQRYRDLYTTLNSTKNNGPVKP